MNHWISLCHASIRGVLALVFLYMAAAIYLHCGTQVFPVAIEHPVKPSDMHPAVTYERVTLDLTKNPFTRWYLAAHLWRRECFSEIRLNNRDAYTMTHNAHAPRCAPTSISMSLTDALGWGHNTITFELAYRMLPRNPLTQSLPIGLAPVVTDLLPCYPAAYPWFVLPYIPPEFSNVSLDVSALPGTEAYHGGLHPQPYRVVLFRSFTETGVLTIVTCLGLALWAAYLSALASSPRMRRLLGSPAGRALTMAFIPCMGLLALWTTGRLVRPSYVWKYDLVFLTILTAIPPVTLLLSVLDRTDRPFRLRAQWLFIALSACMFGYVCNELAAGSPHFPAKRYWALLACVLGFLATVPPAQLWDAARRQPKATAIAAIAILCVHIYWVYLAAMWNVLASLTGTLVQSVLLMTGTPTSLATYHLTGPHLQIYSQDFGVDIWHPCSGLEGVTLVVYLMSLLFLSAWKTFAPFRYLWDAYLVAIPLMLAANVLRISAFFLYGSYLHHHNTPMAMTLTTEVFHSNVGLVFYLVTIGACLPLLYRSVRKDRDAQKTSVVP